MEDSIIRIIRIIGPILGLYGTIQWIIHDKKIGGIIGKLICGLPLWVTLSFISTGFMIALLKLVLWLWDKVVSIVSVPQWAFIAVGAIVVLAVLIYLTTKGKISETFWDFIFIAVASCALIIIPALIFPFILDIGDGPSTYNLIIDNWYNPLIWVKCWWLKTSCMGWGGITLTAAAIILTGIKIHKNDDMILVVRILTPILILWFSSFIISIIKEVLMFVYLIL